MSGLPFFHSHILFTLYAGNTRRSRAAACSRGLPGGNGVVLLLNAEGTVVAAFLQLRQEGPPPGLVVTGAGGNEVPGTAGVLQHALGIQQGIGAGGAFQPHVLDVHVVDTVLQCLRHRQRVRPHPEQVAGVQVHTQNIPHLAPADAVRSRRCTPAASRGIPGRSAPHRGPLPGWASSTQAGTAVSH